MQNTTSPHSAAPFTSLTRHIKNWANELGFQQCGICEADPKHHADHYQKWLADQHHGNMGYMLERKALRLNPQALLPDALRVISVRMDYRKRDEEMVRVLDNKDSAYIAEYALGRDYHKLMRKRLGELCKKIEHESEELNQPPNQRPFVDSAPILERAYAEQAGIGWIGKNTMLINSKAGSWFFLGEILTDLPLDVDPPHKDQHCGSCTACLDACPTNAFSEAHVLDARKCISYLTIESSESIPVEYRKKIGNRVFGCDDCQIVCPWNKFSKPSQEDDFSPRNKFDKTSMLALFKWTEEEFNQRTQGSPIRRIGYERWLRNLAIGLGNGSKSEEVVNALKEKLGYSPMVTEHVRWAIQNLEQNKA